MAAFGFLHRMSPDNSAIYSHALRRTRTKLCMTCRSWKKKLLVGCPQAALTSLADAPWAMSRVHYILLNFVMRTFTAMHAGFRVTIFSQCFGGDAVTDENPTIKHCRRTSNLQLNNSSQLWAIPWTGKSITEASFLKYPRKYSSREFATPELSLILGRHVCVEWKSGNI